MRRYRKVLFLMAIAVISAGCSGGGDSQTTTVNTVAPVPQDTAGTDPALVSKARAATLQPADFPAGFVPQPEEPGQGLSIDVVWRELTRCLGVEATTTPAGLGTSPTYKLGLATQGRSTVEYVGEPRAAALATALAGPKAQQCLTQVFIADVDRSKPQGAKAGAVSVTPRDPAAVVPGQKALAWRINAAVLLDELTVPLFQDFMVIFDRGTVIRMFFLSPGSEFPQTLEKSLVDKVVVRAYQP